MATVNGVETKPDQYGKIQGTDGGTNKMAGGSGNDQLQGHGDFNQYYGGAGNDTFVLAAKFGQTTGAPSKDYGTLATYITDFHGAGGSNEAENDFINLTGFGADSKIELISADSSGSASPAKMLHYSIFDTHTGKYYNFQVNSLNGKELGATDFNFYGSTSHDFNLPSA